MTGTKEATDMRVRVFGQIEAIEGQPHLLGGPTQRRVFAALVAHRNESMSIDELVEACWDDGAAPERAAHNVRTYVHRLRTALGDTGDRIETTTSGYSLRVERGDVDIDEFDELASTAGRLTITGDHTEVLRLIDEAEALWRGRPYAEFADEPWAVAEVARLTELRWTLAERRAEALLGAGRPADAGVLLERLTGEEPLRERPRALLMRALYESGRQAEALRAYQAFRTLMIDEIGVEPSSELVELDRTIASGALRSSNAPSRSVGNFDLHERIGTGAFAIVHRATQRSLHRDVAVKIVRAELADQPEFIRRFDAEAQMVAAIEHPNVVALYDYWREPGQAYLVMRWMTGGSLEARLDDGPWTLDDTVALVDQIAGALDAAHAHGVVHRDVKPANILFDEAGRAYLGDFGIALTADERSTPQAALSEGSPLFASPEQLRRQPAGPETDVHALGIVAFTVLAGRTPFADSPDDATLLRRQLEDNIPAVSSLRPDISAAIDEVLSIATAKRASDRYPTASGFALALRAAAGQTAEGPTPSSAVIAANPYKGLQAFAETDADDFHGRERLVDELLAQLRDPVQRLLTLVGPSGSGKSSVVRAGLIPALRDGRVPGSSSWFVTTMIPGAQPFEALETALLRVAINPPAALLEQLRDGDRGMIRAIRRILPDHESTLLLVVDQFEELFVGGVRDHDRDQFLRALAVVATEANAPVRIVITLRADFYDQPLRHTTFAPLVKQSTTAITPLAPDELESSITIPAVDSGMQIEPGLVAEIMADVAGQPGALPMLQFALSRLFEATDGSVLTIAAYRSIGGISGALAQRADALYADADADEQTAIRNLFGRLVALGEGTEDTRRRIRRAELPAHETIGAAVDRYGSARLLTFDRDPSSRESTVEIAHEALLREWPRLSRWLDDDRDALRAHRHLTAAADSWNARDRDPDELYQGARLSTAEALIESDSVELNPLESDFVAASVGRRTTEEAREQQRVRRLHRLVVATAVVAAIALVAGAIALWQRQRAEDQAVVADQNAVLAGQRAAEAEAARSDADSQRLDAEAQRLDADAQRLRADNAAAVAARNEDIARDEAAAAAVARDEAEVARTSADIQRLRSTAVAESTEQPSVAALLAVEATRLDPGRESDDAMHRVLTAIPGYRGHIDSFAFPAEVSTDGTILTATGPDTVDVWDLTTMTQISSVEHDAIGPEEWGKTSPDGTHRVFTGQLGTRVFDLATGGQIASIDTNGSIGYDVMYSPDSTRIGLIVGRELLVLDALTLETIEAFAELRPGIRLADASWSPYDDVMSLVWSDGALSLLDMSTGGYRWQRSVADGIGGAFAKFTADGQRLITFLAEADPSGAVEQRMIRTLDTADGSEVRAPTATEWDFWQITPVGVHGDELWANAPGAVTRTLAYDLDAGIEIDSPAPAPGAIGIIFSPALDLAITWANAGVDLWARDGSSPLERRIHLPGAKRAANSNGSGPPGPTTSIDPEVTRLRWSTAEGGPGGQLDLTVDRPVASPPPPGVRSTDGNFTVVVAAGGAWIEDANDQPLGPPVEVAADVTDVAVSSDGRFFSLVRTGGVVELYVADGTNVATLNIPGATSYAPAFASFSGDGSLIAAFIQGGSNARAVWDTASLQIVSNETGLERLRFYLAGDVLYTNRIDLATIERLDPRTLEPIGEPLVGHATALAGVAGDSEHHLVATQSFDGSVRLWDEATGQQFGRDMPSNGSGIQFLEDGKALSVPAGDYISLWNLDTSTWPEIACSIAGRNLTREEWDDFGPATIEYRATCEQFPIDP